MMKGRLTTQKKCHNKQHDRMNRHIEITDLLTDMAMSLSRITLTLHAKAIISEASARYPSS